MIENRSVPTSAILPHLIYPDVGEAAAWLSSRFGFAEHYRYGDPVAGVQMYAGAGVIMLSGPKAGAAPPSAAGGWTQSLTVFVADVDTHFERVKSAGAKIVEALHETPYGERQYGVEDFGGHRWLFAAHARDVDPAAWGAVVAPLQDRP